MVLQVGESSISVQQLLSEKLDQADNLRLGQLENGLKYVMLPNKLPPQRFEAHLEMHAGEPTHLAELLHFFVKLSCRHLHDVSAAVALFIMPLFPCLMMTRSSG